MVAVSVVLLRLVADSEHGRSDAALAQAQTTAGGVYRTAEARAALAGRGLARSSALSAAIASGESARIQAQLAAQARRARAVRAELTLPDGRTVAWASAAPGTPVAPADTPLTPAAGAPAGTLRTSVQTAAGLARSIADA